MKCHICKNDGEIVVKINGITKLVKCPRNHKRTKKKNTGLVAEILRQGVKY